MFDEEGRVRTGGGVRKHLEKSGEGYRIMCAFRGSRKMAPRRCSGVVMQQLPASHWLAIIYIRAKPRSSIQ